MLRSVQGGPQLDEAVLGVDVGTSSTKGALATLDGRLIATATRPHAVDRPRPGHVEMDAAVWWAELVAIARELLAAHNVDVRCVGVSGMGPCVLPADARGRALRPAILYGVDTRAERQIEELQARYGEAEIAARGGSALSTQAVGPKIAWLADEEPEVFEAMRLLFMPSSWLVYQLTGEYVLDHHSASQSTPLYDVHRQEWYEPWWRDLAPAVRTPRLLWSGEPAGSVSAEAARATGLPAGVPVIAGTIDAWAEAVSVDAHNVGDLMLMYGSTMFLIHTVADALSHPTLWSTVGVYPGTRNLAGGMATSGAVTDWLRSLFGSSEHAELLAAADESGPRARGLLMLPYLAGERTPIADPRARGVIAGLTVAHTRGDLYRAALESTAFGVRHNIEALEAAGAQIERVVAVGGGTQGGLWAQIVSDVTGRPQELPEIAIGACFGGAFLAARALGAAPATWNRVARTIEPDAGTAGGYDEQYELYRDLYPATEHIAHALAGHQLRPRVPISTQEGSSRT
jgi:xylulokinase